MGGTIGYILAAALAAAVAGTFTYLVARRSSSGRIGTSTAENLWAESNSIRVYLANEVNKLRERDDEQDRELRDLRDETDKCKRRERALRDVLVSHGIDVGPECE